jgi:alanine dehydrogenase
MGPEGTLVLTRSDVAALLGIEECIAAVEQAFRLHAEGSALPPGVLGIHARTGGFHIKAGLLDLNRSYFAAKTNANFPENAKRFGLPLIQGVIVVCDAENGYPLAVMDSMEITIIRTGAATAVAAKYLARPDSSVATICGCGNQGRISLRAMTKVLPLKQVYAFDKEPTLADSLANELSKEMGIDIKATNDLGWAARQSDVCVTCTPSKEFFLNREYVRPGTFVAGVGADNEEKQELDPRLLQSSKVVVDLLEQCATIGELHHALEQGLMTRAAVHAELGEVIAGKKPGRTSADEIIVFDSTGTALQDVASAAIVYERAVASGRGMRVDFAE